MCEQTSDSKRDIEIESGQKHEEIHHVEERHTSEGEADPDSVKDTVIRASMSKMDDVWNTSDYEQHFSLVVLLNVDDNTTKCCFSPCRYDCGR